MPKLSIDHSVAINSTDALQKIKAFFESDQDLKKLDPKLHCEFDSSGKGKISGSQFKAEIVVKAKGSGSEINVMIDLPLMLTPFKGKIQEMVQKKLAKFLS
ncbi:MAG: polyhydroxyalkanoic acid system family protein [Proteobacteria bacterium]|jgi:hypothetical protein|nr:polyhydroxyalkanoic acid system family protein [Pseudomonadota bacterium]